MKEGKIKMLPIIAAIRDENDRDYVDGIYRENCNQLFETANRILELADDCWDCVHDTVVILIDSLQSFREMDATHQSCFLHMCCRNNALNRYHKIKRRMQHEASTLRDEDGMEFDIVDYSADVNRIVFSKELIARAEQIVSGMGARYVDMLYLRFIYGFSDADAAKILGITPNTYRVCISRMRKRLFAELRKENWL